MYKIHVFLPPFPIGESCLLSQKEILSAFPLTRHFIAKKETTGEGELFTFCLINSSVAANIELQIKPLCRSFRTSLFWLFSFIEALARMITAVCLRCPFCDYALSKNQWNLKAKNYMCSAVKSPGCGLVHRIAHYSLRLETTRLGFTENTEHGGFPMCDSSSWLNTGLLGFLVVSSRGKWMFHGQIWLCPSIVLCYFFAFCKFRFSGGQRQRRFVVAKVKNHQHPYHVQVGPVNPNKQQQARRDRSVISIGLRIIWGFRLSIFG